MMIGQAGGSQDRWELRLYIAAQTPRSIRAMTNLKQICEEHLQGRYEIEVIDLMEAPHLAQEDQIVAIPTLIRKAPPPTRRLIGDLSDREKVLMGLNVALAS